MVNSKKCQHSEMCQTSCTNLPVEGADRENKTRVTKSCQYDLLVTLE